MQIFSWNWTKNEEHALIVFNCIGNGPDSCQHLQMERLDHKTVSPGLIEWNDGCALQRNNREMSVELLMPIHHGLRLVCTSSLNNTDIYINFVLVFSPETFSNLLAKNIMKFELKILVMEMPLFWHILNTFENKHRETYERVLQYSDCMWNVNSTDKMRLCFNMSTNQCSDIIKTA